MNAALPRGPKRWPLVLAEHDRVVRSHVYMACASCREQHVGWCLEDLSDETRCPLCGAGGDVLPKVIQELRDR